MNNFRVGQKVVCVNATSSGHSSLVEGAEYTVKGFPKGPGRNRLDGVIGEGVLLCEIAPLQGCGAFDVRRFRPVVERKTDISVFTSMLAPNRKEAVG